MTTMADKASEAKIERAPSSVDDDGREILRIAAVIDELKSFLRGTDVRIGIERALVRELDTIQSRLKDASRTQMQGVVDELRLLIHLGVLDARERLTLVEPFIRRVLGRMERTKRELTDTAAPTAKLQLELARMEAADVVAARRRRAHDELRTVERATEHVLDDIIARIDELTMELRGRP